MKRMTRRQVEAWFVPIRAALREMLSGEVDSIKGYAVARLHTGDDYARVDECIEGFIGVIGRIFKGINQHPLKKIQKHLCSGAPLTESDVHAALAFLKSLETPLIKADWQAIKEALQTEMIHIELMEMGIAS